MGPPLAQGIRWCTSQTDGGWVQPWELTVLVALDDGGAQVRRDGAGGAAEVQWLAGGAERGAEQGAAQLGGEPAGPGQQVEAPAQDGGLQPPPGGLQAAGYPAVAVARGGGGLAGAGAVAGAGERDVAVERAGRSRGVAGAGGWLVRVAAVRPAVGSSSRGPSGWSSVARPRGLPAARARGPRWSSRGPCAWSSRGPSGVVVRLAFPWPVRVVFRLASRGPCGWSPVARPGGRPAGCRCGRGRGW